MNAILERSKQFLRRNGSTILTCVGAAGVVTTAVMAAKATPKAISLLEKAKEEKGEDLTKLEKVKVAGPAYIPTVVVGAATIACVFGSNVLNKKQQAGLASAYALLDSSYKEYKKKVEELYGEEANQKVTEEIAKDKYEESDIEHEDGKWLFYDDFSGRYFNAKPEVVQAAEYQLNRDLFMRGWVTLNEYYEYLNIEPIDGGDVLGWSIDSNLEMYWQEWIDFGHHKTTMDDGLECTIIYFFLEPVPNYDEYL